MYFRKGQKVVCIKSHSNKVVLKGQTFTIALMNHCACGSLGLLLEEVQPDYIIGTSCVCGHITEGAFFSAELFSPLLDNFADNVLAEIKEQAEEEFFQPIIK